MLAEAPTTVQEPAQLPAGGSDPTRFDWKEVWYPTHYVVDLDRDRPNKFTLLERDLVIWWDANADCWRAFDDACPHRLAPLSEGRIAEDGLLECPYHGWAFRGDGACDRIPQALPDSQAHASPRACVASLPVAERQGLLFVYAGEPENASRVPIPLVNDIDENDGWVCLKTFRDLPYDALTLLENVLDSSHVPFTHHRSVGNRDSASPVELELRDAGKQGFTGFWAVGPRKGSLGSQSTTFIAPNLMWHDLTSKQFGRTLTVVYATPIRKGECRLFALFPFKFSSPIPRLVMKLTPRWYSHRGQNNVLEDDQIFLHLQERYLEARGGSPEFARAFYLPTRADTFVTALRKWVNEFAANPFPGESLPPARSPEVLLDRYHSHTKHCASCRGALHRVRQFRLGAAIVGLASWLVVPLLTVWWGSPSLLLAALAALVPLLAGGLWLWLGQWERQFIEGRAIPPRNLPES